MIDKEAAEAAVMAVGTEIVAATRLSSRAAAASARAIATFVEHRALISGIKIDLGNGQDGALARMYDALGTALKAQEDQLAARLTAFSVTKHLELNYGEFCPCGEGPPPSKGEETPPLRVVAEIKRKAA